MCRTILISLAVASLAVAGLGAVSIVCDESKVGLTYPMDDPLSYWTCHDANTPMVFSCAEGSGYIKNGTLTGCVPWVLWECTSKAGPPACNKNQQLTKYPNTQPNLFWICQGINLPEAIACPDGSAFLATGSNPGCQDWSVWLQSCPY